MGNFPCIFSPDVVEVVEVEVDFNLEVEVELELVLKSNLKFLPLQSIPHSDGTESLSIGGIPS